MVSFMQGITHSDMTSEAPQSFAMQMGDMMRQFMIGFTGNSQASAAVFGELMGDMSGALVAQSTHDSMTPMTSIMNSMTSSFAQLSKTASQGVISIMNASDDLVANFVHGIDANLALIQQWVNRASDTLTQLSVQAPTYIDTILSLSDDILTMADRINQMADRIVQTQLLMSDNFITTQQNAIVLVQLLNQHPSELAAILSEAQYKQITDNLSTALMKLSAAQAQVTPVVDYSATLYLQTTSGSLVTVSADQLQSIDGRYTDVSELTNGTKLLVGYTIPIAQFMSMAQTIEATHLVQPNINLLSLPLISSNISVEMTSMIRSMMDMMMGKALNIPFEERISTNCLSVIDSFALGMGVSRDEFEVLFNRMMDSMLGNEFFSTLIKSSETILHLTQMDHFLSPQQIVHSLMDTFFAEGTPMATMMDMMGTMMSAFAGQVTGFGQNATPLEIAYASGELMKSFMIGLTADPNDPVVAMSDMMGSMMNRFMANTIGNGEHFTTVIDGVIHQITDTFIWDMSSIRDDVNQNFVGVAEALDHTIAQLSIMMHATQDNLWSVNDQSERFEQVINGLSSDVVQMVDRVGGMMERVDQTIDLQTDNLRITQQHLTEFIGVLSEESNTNPALSTVLGNLMQAQSDLSHYVL